MADGGTTEWIFDGLRHAVEFREVGEEGSTKIQKRKVTAFSRFKFYTPADGVIPTDSTGQTNSGTTLNAEQGSRTIKASRLIIGGNVRWVCVTDATAGMDRGLDALKRIQRWETRGDWQDYSWPTS